MTRPAEIRGSEDSSGTALTVGLGLTGGLIALAAGRSGRRSALRGLASAASASAVAAFVEMVSRRRWRVSAQIAAVAGFAVGTTIELPLAAVPIGVGGLVVAGLQFDDAQWVPRRAWCAAALGTAVALASRRPWPVAPKDGADLQTVRSSGQRQPSPEGAGVALVVNPNAGSALDRDPAAELRDALPDATIIDLGEDDDLVEALERLASNALALGVAGGDGSLNAAAEVAYSHDLPLVAVPGGTLNHFARDLGVQSVADAVTAVHEGRVVAVDLARIADGPFLNTAGFGSYPELVDLRERLEDHVGKWPAMALALIRVLRHGEPVEVELDGQERRIWMIFIGNCRYHPSGFAPSWRARLDDGQLDIRVVDATMPWGRTRLVLAVLTGRLGRCRVYEQRSAPSLHVRSLQGPLRLARDGETFDGPAEFVVNKYDRPLAVYGPAE